MAWTVILEVENKEGVSSLDIDFNSELIFGSSKGKQFKLVRYIDPYGDTIFNQLQMDDLISDLEALQEINHSNDIKKIIDLAIKCKQEPHLYLAFYGD